MNKNICPEVNDGLRYVRCRNKTQAVDFVGFYDTIHDMAELHDPVNYQCVFFYQQFPVAFDLINESATMNWYTVVKVQLYGL